jgi:ABC-2 type transport system ATP-binding protein
MDAVINVTNLHKSYGTTIAVDDISFAVKEGEIFGMVGPNGAGKTTTIECLEGLREPDAGQVRVLGVDPHLQSRFLHTHAGMQLQDSNLPERIKVWEALDLFGSFYPTALDSEGLLVQLGLDERRNSTFTFIRRAETAPVYCCINHDRNCFLDELTTGSIPSAMPFGTDANRASKGKTIFLTTHYMKKLNTCATGLPSSSMVVLSHWINCR